MTSREYWISSFLIEQHQHISPPFVYSHVPLFPHAMLQPHFPDTARVPVLQAAGTDPPPMCSLPDTSVGLVHEEIKAYGIHGALGSVGSL